MGIETALIMGGSALLGGLAQSRAATRAAETQYRGTQEAAAQQRAMFDILNAQQAPYREAGGAALTRIQEMLPFFTGMPTAEQVRATPGYQFGLEQGLGAVGQGMNVLSPGSNVDLARMKFAQDYALQQAYPLYTAQQTNIYNRLASLAGLGQAGTAASGQLGQQTGANLAQLATGGASALAGGQIGAANALAGGLGGVGNAAMLYNLIRPQTATSAFAPGGMASSGFGTGMGFGNQDIGQFIGGGGG